MANVTGQIGQESVILENAATEETLKKLVATLTTMNQSIVKTGGGSGASGAAEAADALGKLGVAAKLSSMAFSLIGGILSGIGNVVTAATGAFIDLAEQAIDNKAKMSDFYGALGKVASEIPIFGGVLGGVIGIFQQMAAMQEKNLEVYQKLSQTGINFGGSLTNLRMAASNSYMSLDAFAALMQKNSTLFAKMGGNVNDGAEAFAKMSHELIKSPAGDRLLALGYTTDQVNAGMADYISMTGGRNAQEMKNTKAVTAGATAYMEQLDGLAQLTGKNREQLAEEMKKRAANAAWEAKLQGMTEEERKKATLGMANALAAGGEGAADAFQAQVMGVAVQTKAGQAFTGMYGAGAEKIRQSADMVTDSTKDQADMNKTLLDTQDVLAEEQKKYGSQTSFALQMQGSDIGKVSQAIQSNSNQVNQSTREAREAALKKKDLSDTEAAKMAEANKGMQEFGQQIMGFLTPIIKELTPIMTGILDQFKEWFSTVDLPALGNQIGDVLKAVAEYLKNFISEEGRDKILNDIKYMFGLAWIEIKKAINPFYGDNDAAKDKAKLDADKKVFDDRADAAKKLNESVGKAKKMDKDTDEASQKANKEKRDALQKDIQQNANLKIEKDAAFNKMQADRKAAKDPMKNWGPAYANRAPIDPKLAAMDPIERMQLQYKQQNPATNAPSVNAPNPDLAKTNNVVASNTETVNLAANYTATMPENSSDPVDKLNKHNAEMLRLQREQTDYSKKTYEATRALNNNSWA